MSELEPAAGGEPRVPSRPSLVISATIPLPDGVDIPRLDDWLATALEMTVDPPPWPPAGDDGGVAAFLWRGLLVAREFLQAARVPAFDPPAILAIRPAPDRPGLHRVAVALPRIDQIPVAAYSLAFHGGVDTCRQAARLGHAADAADSLLAAIVRQVIEPMRGMVPAGRSAMPLLRAAHRLGMPSFHLGGDVHQIGWGCRGRLVDRSISTADSALGARIVGDKRLAALVIRHAGLPAPEHEPVTGLEDARRAADRLGFPVVVKPVDRDRGEGVTTGVRTAAELAAAVATALDASPGRRGLVEREVPGVCHRVFVAGGRLLYAVRRLPLSVTGDGRSTVEQLVAAAAARELARPPWRREQRFALDPLAVRTLASLGISAGSVPSAAARVPLRPIETTAWGGCDEEVTAAIHPENVRIALRAAEVFGLDVAGVDMITTDISRPWHETGGVITEVNFAPLLGGGEVSLRHLDTHLRRLIPGDGRIPVEVFVGGTAALAAAVRRRAALEAAGVRTLLTSHDASLDASGRPLPLAVTGCYARCRALLADPAAEAVVLVVQTDEFERIGLPVDRITALVVADRRLGRHEQPLEPAAERDVDGVVERLEQAVVRPPPAIEPPGTTRDGG